MRKKTWVLVALFVGVILISCGEGNGPADSPAESPALDEPEEVTYLEEIREGVTFVHNTGPLWGETPKIRLELMQVLGGPGRIQPRSHVLQAVGHRARCPREPLCPGRGKLSHQEDRAGWNIPGGLRPRRPGPGRVSVYGGDRPGWPGPHVCERQGHQCREDPGSRRK